MFRFPFSNYQELNLDWILAKVKEFAELVPGMREVLDKSEQALADATEAVETANEAKEIAEQAVQGIVGPNSVNSAAIQAGAVTREKIAAGAVDSSRLSENAVYSINIADGEIVSNKIRAGAVTTAKIADGSINTTKIADAQVTTAKLADGAVTAHKIAPGAIPQATIADGSVTTAKLADGAVTAAKIASGAVSTAKIESGAVTSEKLANDSVNGDKIADGSITNAMLSSNFVFPSTPTQAMSFDLLWSNSNPGAIFNPQTVNIPDSSSYKFFILVSSHPQEGWCVHPILKGNNFIYTPSQVDSSGYIAFWCRNVNMQTTICEFKAAYGKSVDSNTAGGEVTTTFRPLYLYGVK